ncbi:MULTISPECIES: acyl carrier protein [Shewanella]|jgi:acyl carrier protein|uniref:acyl carrier protein n=1 Tax=Shewanella TaxID=22 RepID=UPI000E831688|nr:MULTISPECIES: acyl carrier protein [Shewanella]MBB1380565.1 acyl carrier protein [Shewanella sp. SR41-2]MBB1426086.1 acyl carrier protein [Shewanella sp. SG44-2]RPA31992.1 acyl carrier protein [Shewanella frigidimarina]HBF48240.1 acyl carrier protein [Shewanella frigidimarina]|tara:strand:+ start:5064 stop:5312 length:249 start_codon:yes stop_codon:yes gene_type:complete
MQNREQILEMLSGILIDEFEIEAADITLEASLYEDLDLDSIDAVDLVIKLQQLTGKKIQPEAFKTVRTVNDVVNAIEGLIKS